MNFHANHFGRLGYEAIPWPQLAEMTPLEYGDRVRERVGGRPAFFSTQQDSQPGSLILPEHLELAPSDVFPGPPSASSAGS